MLGALATSALFLVSYVTYHLNAGSRPFPGQGPIRLVYFAILITHVILAAVDRAAGARHGGARPEVTVRQTRQDRALDLPMWLYVSVTGVVIYLMLYVLY